MTEEKRPIGFRTPARVIADAHDQINDRLVSAQAEWGSQLESYAAAEQQATAQLVQYVMDTTQEGTFDATVASHMASSSLHMKFGMLLSRLGTETGELRTAINRLEEGVKEIRRAQG